MSSTTDLASSQGGHEGDIGISKISDNRLRRAEPTFVEWAPAVDDPPPRKTPPRLYHKKSRTGCAQCKARRVKCDEIHPICGNCHKHTVECTYVRLKNSKMKTPSLSKLVDRTRSYETCESSSSKKIEPRAREIPESQTRRLLELGLLHRYMSVTFLTLTEFAGNVEKQKYWWSIALPQKAFSHDVLLNSIYAITALHWSKLEPDNKEAFEAHRKYMDLTLSGHRNDVLNIEKKIADVVCLTSTLIRMCIFSGLETRDLDSYTPPSAWLKTTQVSGEVWASSWKWIKDDKTSISRAFFNSTPVLAESSVMFHAENRRGLNYLLQSNLEDDAPQLANSEIAAAYETTVSYIGGIKLAIAARESRLDIFRRLVLFPMFISTKFTTLVDECQPRALVILCHYFALLTEMKDFWWIGDLGEREIRAAEKILPQQWLPLLAWPIRVLRDPSILTSMKIENSIQSLENMGVEIVGEKISRGGSTYSINHFKLSG